MNIKKRDETLVIYDIYKIKKMTLSNNNFEKFGF